MNRSKIAQNSFIFSNENEFKAWLEKEIFPCFFDNNIWEREKNIRQSTLQYNQQSHDRIDYFGFRDGVPTYIEVKNGWIRQRYLLQITKYYCQINEELKNRFFDLYVFCSIKCRPHREQVLLLLNIKILSYKEIVENFLKKNEKVWSWM